MKRLFSVLCFLLVLFSTTLAISENYWEFPGGEIWAHPNSLGSYSVGFNYNLPDSDYQFTQINVSSCLSNGQGCSPVIIESIYPQRSRLRNYWSGVWPNGTGAVKFDGDVILYGTGAYTIKLQGILPDGTSMQLTEFSRYVFKFAFELNEVVQDGDNMRITYIMFPLFGNSVSPGTPIWVQFGGYNYTSSIDFAEDGKYFCTIYVPSERYHGPNEGQNFCNDTRFSDDDFWLDCINVCEHTPVVYPAIQEIPWQRPAEQNEIIY
ncbi:MAG: hypothetical protein NTZ97_05160 [Candidatus Moranbacteria bacterium]|nr:hypothetical protein [Candidatus Moranbacteria bacterium]